MNVHKEGWFSEINERLPGTLFSLKANKVLYDEKSDYQDILVIETKDHGNALILDGLIQCTEAVDFSYQESITFMPLSCHPNPENVLIVGGGLGGDAREVAKYPGVKNITLVEIDSRIPEVARKYFPSMSVGLDHPNVNLIIADGYRYMKDHTSEFDVIITDNSDPVGPSLCLYGESYFKLMSSALRPGGIVCSQAGSVWVDVDHVAQTLENCRSAFAVASYCAITDLTCPTGQIGFVMGSLNPDTKFEEPLRTFSKEELDDMQMRYYSSDLHRAAFVLPRFAIKAFAKNKIVS